MINSSTVKCVCVCVREGVCVCVFVFMGFMPEINSCYAMLYGKTVTDSTLWSIFILFSVCLFLILCCHLYADVILASRYRIQSSSTSSANKTRRLLRPRYRRKQTTAHVHKYGVVDQHTVFLAKRKIIGFHCWSVLVSCFWFVYLLT